MKAIILARVSTEEQKDAGNSLPAQVKRLEDYCARTNMPIIKQFVFDESAYKTKRDEFDLMLEYLKEQKEKIAVCFDKVDRFSRNVFDKRVSLLYDKATGGAIELHFASDNLVIHSGISATEKFHFSVNLGLAKYYSDAISDSVKRGNENRIREGQWLAKAPVGYLNIRDPKTEKADVVVDSARSYLVRRGFELYAQGTYSVAGIADILRKEGLTNNLPPFRPLSTAMIHRMLKNTFYIGQMKINGQLHSHRYDTFVEKWLFDQCQEVRENWHKKPFKYASKPYVFRGLIKCDHCGRAITSDTKIKKNGKQYTYLYCTDVKHCGGSRVKEKTLLDQISDAFKILSKMPEEALQDILNKVEASCNAERNYHQSTIDSLRSEYDQIQKRFDALLDLRLDSSITQEDYTKKVYEMKQRQMEIDDKLKEYTQADEKYAVAVSTLLKVTKEFAELYKSSNIEEKRQLISFAFSNLRLKGEKLLWDFKKPLDAIAFANTNANWFRDRDSNPNFLDQNQASCH